MTQAEQFVKSVDSFPQKEIKERNYDMEMRLFPEDSTGKITREAFIIAYHFYLSLFCLG